MGGAATEPGSQVAVSVPVAKSHAAILLKKATEEDAATETKIEAEESEQTSVVGVGTKPISQEVVVGAEPVSQVAGTGTAAVEVAVAVAVVVAAATIFITIIGNGNYRRRRRCRQTGSCTTGATP